MMEQKKNIYQKVLAVVSKVGAIQKNGYNAYAKYHYVDKDTLYDYMRKFFVEEGLVLTSSITETRSTLADNNVVEINVHIRLINADNPEEMIEADYPGIGFDKGDKALYKALTGAIKYFLIDTFLVSGGDSVPGDVEHDQPQTTDFDKILSTFDAKQQQKLRALWKIKKLDKDVIVNLAKKNPSPEHILEEVAKL